MKRNLYSILIVTLLLVLSLCPATAASGEGECVVLLHGLARTKRSMSRMAQYLESEGFEVVNIGYPSREKRVQDLANDVIPKAIAKCEEQKADTIHFVTHSLGGILVRYYLEKKEVEKLGIEGDILCNYAFLGKAVQRL